MSSCSSSPAWHDFDIPRLCLTISKLILIPIHQRHISRPFRLALTSANHLRYQRLHLPGIVMVFIFQDGQLGCTFPRITTLGVLCTVEGGLMQVCRTSGGLLSNPLFSPSAGVAHKLVRRISQSVSVVRMQCFVGSSNMHWK